MKSSPKLLAVAALVFTALNTSIVRATDLADVPLANATTITLLPNIFFVLDDSGSMDSDYMPDYVNNAYCRDNQTQDGNMDGNLDNCWFGDPPYMASAFNRAYYNPMINYTPPKNADGTDKTNYNTSPWSAVPLDGFDKQFTSTDSYPRDNQANYGNGGGATISPEDWAYNRGTAINLVTQFPERTWCTSSSDTATCNGNFKSALDASNAYAYPNSTKTASTSYKYLRMQYGAPYYYNVTVEWCKNNGSDGFGSNQCQSTKTATHKYVKFSNWQRVNIVSTTNSYPGPNGTTRTYAEEMTNFANWFAWYRTRMQLMKSAVTQALVDVRGTPNPNDPNDSDFLHVRLGYTTISETGTTDGDKYLDINNFDADQKSTFYTRLTNAVPSSYTPLRGALSKAGRIYAGTAGKDPVEYSCQKNFTILSTDGYWNTNTESSSYGPKQMNNSTNVGDQDGGSSVTLPERDGLQKADTLADVAYYYYHTDLRPGMTDNVAPGGTNPAVDDVATHQHMTTFTIGLGVDGTLAYVDGYKANPAGGYLDILQGTVNWPDPIANTDDERIDDLWHAAVNGRGTYFNARDPGSLASGLKDALRSIQSASGSGAAAATSNLQPVAGDNYIYIANYRTEKWDGELSAYTINLLDGSMSQNAVWTVNAQFRGVTPTNIGEIETTSGNSDNRVIYTWSGTGTTKLKDFTWTGLGTDQSYFNSSTITNELNSSNGWTSTELAAHTGAKLVNYLRGQDHNEDEARPAITWPFWGTYDRLYRNREKVLGDVVHAQPVYVKAPFYDYLDTGYASFKTSQATRAGRVYLAANDGMLHAFDSATGAERWAYVPPMVLGDLWKLARDDWSSEHKYFLDGPTSVSDIYDTNAWKTILVGAMGKGGKGIYALDVTAPDAPKALWNFTHANLGYTYGTPIITKIGDTWVVLVASGYNNNEGTGTGVGYVFVLNAATGALIKTFTTNVGDTSNPSGLAHLNVKVSDFQRDNTTTAIYGGDLLGNMWRFDPNANDGAVGTKVVALTSAKPITVVPEIGEIEGQTVLFFGTGRYLGPSDLSLPVGGWTTQSFYAVKDDGTTEVDETTALVQQTADNTDSRIITPSTYTGSYWSGTKAGWYIDLPGDGERVNLPAQLYFGTILFASTVPTANECQPGGYSYLYALDYATGQRVSGATENAWKYVSPLVGVTVAKLPSGTVKIYGITADGNRLTTEPPSLPINLGGAGSDSGIRVMWRELLN